MLGVDLHRNVTVIRLANGDLVIHSTGPFSAEDIATITHLGRPAWLLDTLGRHDTFAKEGRAAFPTATYLAPDGFSETVGFPVGALQPKPDAWGDELDVLEVSGAPTLGEHLVFHRASRTLIVADLIFHFPPPQPLWPEILLQLAIGREHAPGMSRPFKTAILDRPAFEASIAAALRWDFDRIVVGHGEVIETGGKAKLRAALQREGFSLPA